MKFKTTAKFRKAFTNLPKTAQNQAQKDLTVKRAVYAAAGIEDYWILDLKESQLIVFRAPQEGEYRSEERLQQGEISPLAFPDLTFSVSQLLA